MRVTSESDNCRAGTEKGLLQRAFVEVQDATKYVAWLRYTVRVPKPTVSNRSQKSGDVLRPLRSEKKLRGETDRRPRSRVSGAFGSSPLGCGSPSGCRGASPRRQQLEWISRGTRARASSTSRTKRCIRAAFRRVLSPHFDRARVNSTRTAIAMRSKSRTQSQFSTTRGSLDLGARQHLREDPARFSGLTAVTRADRAARATMFALRYKGVDYIFNARRRCCVRARAAPTPRTQTGFLGRSSVRQHRAISCGLWSDLAIASGSATRDPDVAAACARTASGAKSRSSRDKARRVVERSRPTAPH